ncbi:MAG: hypothetical protein JNG84_00145 [Archangium sp.]|nr:hypothetical protein [Archangium sp.]
MTHCGRVHQLEALVAGEVPEGLAYELRSHAEHCARCRHELKWLETERQLARRRAGRDEVEHLWREALPERRGLKPMTRGLLGLAAVLLLVLNVGRVAVWAHGDGALGTTTDDEWSLQSFDVMSRFEPPTGDAACSRLQPGLAGFHCGSVPASFIASR